MSYGLRPGSGGRVGRGVRRGVLAVGFVVSALPAAADVNASDPTSAPAPPRVAAEVTFDELPAPARAAIERGLDRLVALQNDDGSFGGGRYGRHAGITAIAALALMADGNLPGRGVTPARAAAVRDALAFVLAHRNPAGLLAADVSHGPMYGHGYATLFLGEVYGATDALASDPDAGADPDTLRQALARAVRLIVDTQNDEGGWRYHPRPYDADLSVTITQIMALRSARNAGLAVPKATVDRAVSYVRRCQNPEDGGFRYMLRGGSSAYARSAAGVASLQYAGVYDDDAVTDGLAYLDAARDQAGRGGHYFYGRYYGVQAIFLAGGDHWATGFPVLRDELVERQQPDGGWTSSHGEAYGTGMALLVLQMPNRLLPIFQR